MALSMEEQRILAEMERQLAGDDPSLALRLSKFGRPGLAAGLRTPRGRVLASFLVVAVVALLSLTVYSLMPLRTVPDRGVHGQRAAPLGQSGQQGGDQQGGDQQGGDQQGGRRQGGRQARERSPEGGRPVRETRGPPRA